MLTHPSIFLATELFLQGILQINLPALEFFPFTPSALQASYRKWDCCTATSPSGRHLNHYFPLLPDSLDNTTKDAFWELHSNILSTIVTSGTVVSRWKKWPR